MTNAFTIGKRALSAAIAGATILWAVGIAAFAVPQTAYAASPGDRIKGVSLSTVYFYGYDGTRSTYPNLKTYETWHDGFSGIVSVSDSELSSLTLSGNIVYRPGSRWIKVDTAFETYVVSTNGTIHWIESEAVAVDFDGPNWNTNIDDVPDTFFVDYSVGASLMTATAFDGMMYMTGVDSYAISWGGERRAVSSSGRTANAMDSDFFLGGGGIDDSSLTAGSDVTGLECNLVDASQTGCVAVPSSGALTFSVSSSNPAGATLPRGANSVELLSFNVSAGTEAATLNALTASMTAIGATTSIANAYLYDGMTRLTDARSVNASTREVVFGSLGLALAAGESKTLTIRVEIAAAAADAAAGDEIAFSISASSDVDAAGTVGGTFPISGNSFSIANVATGNVVITKSGSISNPAIGENDATIGKFKMASNSEASSVREITLKIDNAADHSDFKLWDESVLLATGNHLGKKLVSFDLSASPFAITEGGSNVFTVTADIGGDASKGLGVYVDNLADVVAIGADYGFGMLIDIAATSGTYDGADGSDGTRCNETADNCSFSTTQGGDITFTKTGPGAGSISTNSQDQVLMEFSLTSSQVVTIKDLDIIVFGDDDASPDNDPSDGVGDGDTDDKGLINTGAEGNLSDIKIINVDTGTVVMGPLELDCVAVGSSCETVGANTFTGLLTQPDAAQVIDFTDDFGMVAGETLHLAITADIDNGVTSGTEFSASIDISGVVIEDANGDAVSGIVPSGDITGDAQKAESGTMVVSLASTPGDVTSVDGDTNVDVIAFSLNIGDGSDLTASSLTLAVYADEDGTGTFTLGDVSGADVNDFIASCTLSDLAGNLLAGPKSPETGGASIVFDDLLWTISAGASELMVVTCDFNNPSDGTDVNYFAFDITDVSEDFVVEDADGTDVDPTGDEVNGGLAGVVNIVTLNASGTLAVAVDASSPSADFLLTGTTDNLVATYKLTASIEDFDVTTFTVSEQAAATATGSANSTAYTNNVSTVTLEYPAKDGTTKTKTVAMSGNEAKFSALDMFVAVGSPIKVNAYVDVPSSDRDAGGNATSNEKVQLEFFVDGSNLDNFAAAGADSGTALDDSDASATSTASIFVVRETKPTVTKSASSPSGTGFVPGDQEVLRFNVAASANEDVIINQIVFDMNATDNAASPTGWNEADTTVLADFDIYNLSTDGTSSALDVDGDWAFLTSTGLNSTAAVDIEFVKLTLTTVEVVPRGTTYTYALYFDSTGASASADDSVQFGIAGDVLATPLALTVAADVNGVHAIDATALTVDIDSDQGGTSVIAVGDILQFQGGAERALVFSTDGNTAIVIIRGYNGTTAAALADNDDITRMASSFLWQDDGAIALGTSADMWGGYLVDDLPITGGAMGF